jgi:outer membrane protein OmpA-like peptidoglycan-associated protein
MVMTKFGKAALAVATVMTLGAGAMPAVAQDRWDWHGGGHGDRDYGLIGPGVRFLLPELRESNRGRAFVARNFDLNRNGRIERFEANRANRAFLRIAGPHRDRFDWEARDRGPVVAPGPVQRGGWDHRAMHDYHMRQTRYGATFDLSDVLFQTDSAALRPAALDKLRPLGAYLKANPQVQLRIDGYTDSRASAEHNQLLSQHRAESVESALAGMGVREARFHIEGHGEADPVATNATPQGRQLNRRVSVTLVGQQARSFDD